MPKSRGFSLIDCMIALLISGIATSATFALMQSATGFYRQYRADRVIADIAGHLQHAPVDRLLAQDVHFFNREGRPEEHPAWLQVNIEPGPRKGPWQEVTCTIQVPSTDPQGQTIRLKRLVWQP